MTHAFNRIRAESFVWFLGLSIMIHLVSLMMPLARDFQRPGVETLLVDFDDPKIVPDVSPQSKLDSSVQPVPREKAKALLKGHPEIVRDVMGELVKKIAQENIAVEPTRDETVISATDSDGIIQDYKNACAKKIGDVIGYPLRARVRGCEGQVVLNLTVERSGELKGCEVFLPSEYFDLDTAALEAAAKAAPFKPFPEGLDLDRLKFYTTITFDLEKIE